MAWRAGEPGCTGEVERRPLPRGAFAAPRVVVSTRTDATAVTGTVRERAPCGTGRRGGMVAASERARRPCCDARAPQPRGETRRYFRDDVD